MTTGRGAQAGVCPDEAPIPGTYITNEVMQAVLERQCHRCSGCNVPLDPGSTYFDLCRPVICGGPHTPGNFAAFCPFCHRNHMRRIRERLAARSDHRA